MQLQSEFKFEHVYDPEYIHLRLDHHPDKVIYNIDVTELGKLVRKSDPKFDEYPDRSFWITEYSSGKGVSRSWLAEFQELIQKLAPQNNINWESTTRFLDSLEA